MRQYAGVGVVQVVDAGVRGAGQQQLAGLTCVVQHASPSAPQLRIVQVPSSLSPILLNGRTAICRCHSPSVPLFFHDANWSVC